MPLTRAAMRELDRRAIEEFGIPGIVLMENAGRGAAEILAALNPLRERVAIVCGPGNNGGDGFVMARHLDRLGVPICIWLIADLHQLTPDAATNHRIVERMSLPLTVNAGVLPDSAFAGFGWIVDALFGTGLRGPLRSPWHSVVQQINSSSAKVVAVDIPSGLDCDSGEPQGPTITASHTVTFVGMKEGFLMPSARPFVGEIHFVDIGAPRRLVDEYLRP
ncbi:MAG: NAD(P)H-hydrate epimerase [Gemmataceae bacterium]